MLFFSGFLVSVLVGVRSYFFRLTAFFVVFLFASVMLAAQFSGRQPSVVAMDVGFSIIRVVVPLGLFFLSQDLIFKEFERRYFLTSVSYPRARAVFLVERFLAIIFLSIVLLFFMAFSLLVAVSIVNGWYDQSFGVSLGEKYWAAIFFIVFDFVILASVACFLSVVSTTPSFVLIGACGFMLLGRTYSSVLDLVSQDNSVVEVVELYSVGLGLFAYILPDLGSYDVRMVALYNSFEFMPVAWPWLIASGLGYSFGFLALAIWALNRKRFS